MQLRKKETAKEMNKRIVFKNGKEEIVTTEVVEAISKKLIDGCPKFLTIWDKGVVVLLVQIEEIAYII